MTTATTIKVQLQIRQDTASNWVGINPVLLAGELGRETDTGKIKIGDGVTAWNRLSYQPFGGLISNADISATAEIAVSKLADGTARQLLQTDAAGTGVEWTDNVDVPGTLDVTGAATFDDDVTIEGDLTVNGTTTTIDTETLLVKDKNIELAVVETPTDVTADGGGITLKGATDKTITWSDTTDSWEFNQPTITSGSSSGASFIPTGSTVPTNGIYLPSANNVAISTNGAGRLFVDANGNVGVGASPGAALDVAPDANRNLQVQGRGGTTYGLEIKNGTANTGGEFHITAASSGAVVINRGSSEIARFNSTGLGIGTTPDTTLDVNGAITLRPVSIPGTGKARIYERDSDNKLYIQTGTGDAIRFLNNLQNDLLNIDSSGRLLVGTSSTSSITTLLLSGNSADSAGYGALRLVRNTATPGNGDSIGYIVFGDSGHTDTASINGQRDGGTWSGSSKPTRLVFSTTADGASSPTERMRIGSSGAITFGVDGTNTVINIPESLYLNIDSANNSTSRIFRVARNASDSSGTSLFEVNETGNVVILGSLSKGSGSFRIDHPLPTKADTHYLYHSFIEGPQADLIYRGHVQLVNGVASVNIDEAARMTEGTFESLCTNVCCFTSNESDWTAVRGSVSGNILTIEAQDSTSTADVCWMVVGERKDQHMLETNWTDENGRVITERLKTEVDSPEDQPEAS